MTRYETDYAEEDRQAEAARWEPVASSSRPAQNFVPAVSNRPEVPVQLWTPVSTGDMQIWQPGEAVREETSATDRSIGSVSYTHLTLPTSDLV